MASLRGLLRVPILFVVALYSTGSSAAAAGEAAGPPPTVIVIDKSGSMEGDPFHRLTGAVIAALAILPDGAEVAIVAFDHEAKLLAGRTKLSVESRRELAKAVTAVKPQGGTDILTGASSALNQLPAGGSVLIMSDGFQTGATGNVAWPREKWEPLAKEIVLRAGQSGVKLHSIALGADPTSDGLLEYLSRSTGGEHWGIRTPDELLSRYVDIAAQLSSFWVRSGEAEFTATGDETVIQITDEKAPPTLFRRERDRLSPVAAGATLTGGAVRAERFLLTPGEYLFRPGRAANSALLRPMNVRWSLPAATQLQANREVTVAVQATTAPANRAVVKDVVLTARFDEQLPPVAVKADGEQRFAVTFLTPRKVQKLSARFEATQHGWRYPVGRWSFELITPSPVQVTFKPRAPSPLGLTSTGSGRSVEVEFELGTDTPGVPTELSLSCSLPGVELHPSRVTVNKSQAVTVRLQRPGAADLPPTCKGSLTGEVTSGDLVPPKLNGGMAPAWEFDWRHLRPRLDFRGLTDQQYSVPRGGAISLPVEVAGADLDGVKPGVQLRKVEAPKGITVGLAVRDGGAARTVAALPVGKNGALEVAVGKGVAPGSYPVSLLVAADPETVLLTGTGGEKRLQLTVVVPVIEADVRIREGGSPWVAVAPVEDARREVVVEVSARDGEALPDLEPAVGPVPPIRCVPLGKQGVSPGRAEFRYALTIPAQSPPFEKVVRFSVADRQLGASRHAELSVKVPVVSVRATPVVTGATRYPDWAERALRLFRASPQSSLAVTLEGEGVEEAGCSWALVSEHGGVVDPRTPGQDGLVHFDSVSGQVRLTSRYAHTVFLPTERIPVTHRASVVPVPRWAWAIPVAALLALLLTVAPPLPVEVRWGERVARKLGRVRLGPLLGLPGLRLGLRRGWLGRSVSRAAGGGDGESVVVHTSDVGEVLLLEGMSCGVNPGDRIVVSTAGRTIEITVGPGGPPSTDAGFFTGLETTEGNAVTRPDEWLKS